MVAATLVLLCTRPLEASAFGQMPWLLTVPSIAIIGREVSDRLCSIFSCPVDHSKHLLLGDELAWNR